MAACERMGIDMPLPPPTTAHGAIRSHITGGAEAETFQPMNVNFGLFPDIVTKERGRDKKKSPSYPRIG